MFKIIYYYFKHFIDKYYFYNALDKYKMKLRKHFLTDYEDSIISAVMSMFLYNIIF